MEVLSQKMHIYYNPKSPSSPAYDAIVPAVKASHSVRKRHLQHLRNYIEELMFAVSIPKPLIVAFNMAHLLERMRTLYFATRPSEAVTM